MSPNTKFFFILKLPLKHKVKFCKVNNKVNYVHPKWACPTVYSLNID